VWYGSHYRGSWSELRGNTADLYVQFPEDADGPFDYLTDGQRALIRPGDRVTAFGMVANPRDDYLQGDRPPESRRPYRMHEDSRGWE
jgi:hypothetical protein